MPTSSATLLLRPTTYDIWRELESKVANWRLKFFQLRQQRDQAPHKYVTSLETERNSIDRSVHATGEKLGAELSEHDLARYATSTIQPKYFESLSKASKEERQRYSHRKALERAQSLGVRRKGSKHPGTTSSKHICHKYWKTGHIKRECRSNDCMKPTGAKYVKGCREIKATSTSAKPSIDKKAARKDESFSNVANLGR